MYGAGQYCRNDNDCLSGNELEGLMQSARDYDELLEYWTGLAHNFAADAREVSRATLTSPTKVRASSAMATSVKCGAPAST